jgi:hypothetical protein
MDPFAFCLYLGFAGLLVMAVSGIGARQAGASHHSGSARHGGHDAAPGHATGGHHGPVLAGTRGASRSAGALRWLAPLLNPRLLFTLVFGAGASGLLLRHWLSGPALGAAAVVGAVALERLVVAPIWSLLSRFESSPALTLESGIMDEARAVTAFDANGQGLISLELDGQVVQVLGTLRAPERAAGVRVRAGDRLVIEDVDGKRNRCIVSRAGEARDATP